MSQEMSADLAAVLDRLDREPDRLFPHIRSAAAADSEYLRAPLLDATAEHSARQFIRLLTRAGRDGSLPEAADCRDFADRARDRAAEGLPVVELLDGYHLCLQVLWEEILDVTPPTAARELPVLAPRLFAAARRVCRAVTRAHEQELESIDTEARESIRDLVATLVGGRPAADLARRLGVRLAAGYTVLALGIEPTAAELADDDLERRVAGRRKMIRIHDELGGATGDGALAALDPTGGLILLPVPPAPRRAHLDELLGRLQDQARAAVRAGAARADRLEDLPRATTEARKLLEIRASGPAAAGVATVDDLLVEYQLSQESAARAGLLAVVDALRTTPELTETLDAYFSCDFNRRRTASTLGVHPNTVDNRLVRIAEATGSDPRTSQGLLLLGSALTLARVARA